MSDPLRLSEPELVALFRQLFPQGFAGPDVLAALAPAGWAHSPLVGCFHPTLERWHTERIAQHRHFADLTRNWPKPASSSTIPPELPRPEPTFEDSRRDFSDPPLDPVHECTEIVGAACWNIFSNEHQVIAEDGRWVDLGSWRGSSAFLDEFTRLPPCEPNPDSDATADSLRSLDYGDSMRFYMGLALHPPERCDYSTVYQLVFRRLKQAGLDWLYAFPELNVIRFAPSDIPSPEPHAYDPSAAFARDQEQTAKDAEFARLQEELAAATEAERARARTAPPPDIVLAYHAIYARWPEGWPP
jgi:hypothetical protein